MTLINCPDCDGKLSTEAKVCPHCGKPNDVKLSGPVTINFSDSFFTINRHTSDIIQLCKRAAENMGVRCTLGPTWIEIQGKMWVHNSAVLVLSCEERLNDLTTVNYLDATAHFGPGLGKLTKEFVANLQSIAKEERG